MSKTTNEIAEEAFVSLLEMLASEFDETVEQRREEIVKFACEKYGLVELPRDKNGRAIRINDTLSRYGNRVSVDHMTLDSEGAWSLYSERCGGYIGCGALWQHASELDPLDEILTEAVKRAHDDTVNGKEGTDVTDLLERLHELMGEEVKRSCESA